MHLSTYSTILVLTALLACASSYSPSCSRRTFLTRAMTSGATLVAASRPANATPEQDKESEKRKKKQEEEDRRQAELVKQRLAVGRIGTI